MEKIKKGFACISPERRKEIAAMGGKAAHIKGTAHQFSSEEAKEAGRKGGLASKRVKKAGTAEAAIFDTSVRNEGQV